MKIINLLFLIVLLVGANSVDAQSIKDFKKEIKSIKGITKLSPEQTDKLTSVYEKIVSDLENIAPLKTDNEVLYREKRRSIYKGAEFSIQRIFTKEQREDYKIYQREKRIERANLANKLRSEKASKEDILDAEIGVKQ